MMHHYYIGEWVWNAEEGWTHPGRQAIDLRPFGTQSQRGGTSGMCIVASDAPVTDSHWKSIGQGTLADIQVNDAVRSSLAIGNVRPKRGALGDVLLDMLANQGDPTLAGDEPCLLMPRRDGQMVLRLGGTQQKDRAKLGVDYKARLLQRLRADHSKSVAQDGDRDQKWLAIKSRRFGVNWKEIADPLNHDRPPKKPQTTYTVDFNVSDQSLTAIGWSELFGAQGDVVSNQAFITRASGASEGLVRYDSDLSDDDHYALADVISYETSAGRTGVAVRKDSSTTETYYHIRFIDSTGATALRKLVSGSATNLATGSASPSVTWQTKLDASGSDLESFIDGVSDLTATDAAISGNVRCGMICNASTNSRGTTYDNFEASDGAAGGPTYVQIETTTFRGLRRGVWTRTG